MPHKLQILLGFLGSFDSHPSHHPGALQGQQQLAHHRGTRGTAGSRGHPPLEDGDGDGDGWNVRAGDVGG